MNMMLYKKLTVSYADELQYQMQHAFTVLLQSKIRIKDQSKLNDIRRKTYYDLTLNDLPIYSHIQPDVFVSAVPLINKFLNENGLQIKLATMLVIGKNMEIHCDLSQDYTSYKDYIKNPPSINSAIIFPVFNADKSSTIYYKTKLPYTEYVGEKGRVLTFKKEQMLEIDKFTLDSIYALRIDIPHGVENHSEKPRVVYSIKFNKNVIT